mmetsp:Transcript_31297/g.102082  ORF Transcript_31297/g.102082 Transcript_31297/m.102082 type:complete len:501 (-) Transcript_31297:318-1820(-)
MPARRERVRIRRDARLAPAAHVVERLEVLVRGCTSDAHLFSARRRVRPEPRPERRRIPAAPEERHGLPRNVARGVHRVVHLPDQSLRARLHLREVVHNHVLSLDVGVARVDGVGPKVDGEHGAVPLGRGGADARAVDAPPARGVLRALAVHKGEGGVVRVRHPRGLRERKVVPGQKRRLKVLRRDAVIGKDVQVLAGVGPVQDAENRHRPAAAVVEGRLTVAAPGRERNGTLHPAPHRERAPGGRVRRRLGATRAAQDELQPGWERERWVRLHDVLRKNCVPANRVDIWNRKVVSEIGDGKNLNHWSVRGPSMESVTQRTPPHTHPRHIRIVDARWQVFRHRNAVVHRKRILCHPIPTAPVAHVVENTAREVCGHVRVLAPHHERALSPVLLAVSCYRWRVEGRCHELRLVLVHPCLMDEPRLALLRLVLHAVHRHELHHGVHPRRMIHHLRWNRLAERTHKRIDLPAFANPQRPRTIGGGRVRVAHLRLEELLLEQVKG